MFIYGDWVKADVLKAKVVFDEVMFVTVMVGCGWGALHIRHLPV